MNTKLLLLLCAALPVTGAAQISYEGGIYTQDFNTLNSDSVYTYYTNLPSGWILSSTFVTGKYAWTTVTNGYSNNYGAYCFSRAPGDPDKAIGLVIGSTGPAYLGARFRNETGATLDSFSLSYFVEQWAKGSVVANDQVIPFSYSLDAVSLTTGSFVNVPALHMHSIQDGDGVAAALNGNADSNRQLITGTVSGLSWLPGQDLWIRWSGVPYPFPDAHALVIDDLSFRAVPALVRTFSDGDFNDGDWEAYEIPYLGNQLVETNATGTFSARQAPTGGNPGSFREITIHYVHDDVAVANMQKAAIWSPAIQGALYQVSFSFYARYVQRTSSSGIGFSPILSQAGIFYRGDSGYLPATDQWDYAGFFQGWTAGALDRVDGQPGHPDFSTNGAPIQFGYLSVLAYGPAGETAVSGLDNWSVRLTPVSEPRLSINPIPNAQVLLLWSTEHSDYHLESTGSLSAGEWLAVTNPVTVLGQQLSVLAPAGGAGRFFRLIR